MRKSRLAFQQGGSLIVPLGVPLALGGLVVAVLVEQRVEDDAGGDCDEQDVAISVDIAAAIWSRRQPVIEIPRQRLPIEPRRNPVAYRPAAIRAAPAVVAPPVILAAIIAVDDLRIAVVEVIAVPHMAPVIVARAVEVAV